MLDFDCHTTSAHTTIRYKGHFERLDDIRNLPTELKNTFPNTQCWTSTAILQVLILQVDTKDISNAWTISEPYLQN